MEMKTMVKIRMKIVKNCILQIPKKKHRKKLEKEGINIDDDTNSEASSRYSAMSNNPGRKPENSIATSAGELFHGLQIDVKQTMIDHTNKFARYDFLKRTPICRYRTFVNTKVQYDTTTQRQ